MDKCDVMTGRKRVRVARRSMEWRYTFRPICTDWTDVRRVVQGQEERLFVRRREEQRVDTE